MHRTIDFPNIGIHLKSVGDHITVFGFDIAYYGMIIGLGILVGILIAALEAKRTKQNPEDYYDLAIYAVIFAIIGARIYYVIFSWDMYKDQLLSIFNIRQGGLAIYGGVIAAVITVIIFARIKKLSAPLLMDTAGLGLVAGQMIGRWGNFFNREAFGEYTDSFLAMRLPVDAVRGSDITKMMREHMEREGIQADYVVSQTAIFCSTVIVRGTRLDILSQNETYFPYDCDEFTDPFDFEGAVPVHNFEKFFKRKIYTYNCLAGLISYCGYIKGFEVYGEAAVDPDISGLMDRLLEELNPCLEAYFEISGEEQAAFAKKFREKAIRKYEKELDQIKRQQKKLMPELKAAGEKILKGEFQ